MLGFSEDRIERFASVGGGIGDWSAATFASICLLAMMVRQLRFMSMHSGGRILGRSEVEYRYMVPGL